MIRLSLLFGFAISTSVLVAGVAQGFQFLPSVNESDGFLSQYFHIMHLIQAGDLLYNFDESWLPLIHAGRVVAVAPFIVVEEVVGSAGSLLMLLVIIWPITRVPGSIRRTPVTMLPLFLPLVVSGRSVLVAASVGYAVMYLVERRHAWMLWTSALFTNLSSTSVLIFFDYLFSGELQ